MTSNVPRDTSNEEFWRDFLTRGDSRAARLASVAGAGEVLVTTDAANAAGLDSGLERRRLELNGKQLETEVVTLRVGVG